LALDLRLSEMTFGSFPAKQTGVVVSSTWNKKLLPQMQTYKISVV
jgi:hypothetical protein